MNPNIRMTKLELRDKNGNIFNGHKDIKDGDIVYLDELPADGVYGYVESEIGYIRFKVSPLLRTIWVFIISIRKYE